VQTALKPAAIGERRKIRIGLLLVLSSFLFSGMLCAMLGILTPFFKDVFSLNYTEAMLVFLTFASTFVVVSYPAGVLLERRGFTFMLVSGLSLMGLGCLLLLTVSWFASYALALAAVFLIGSGFTVTNVSGNPFVAAAGPQKMASSRMVLGQAFASVGQTVGAAVGAYVIIGRMSASAGPLSALKAPYGTIAVLVAALAIAVMSIRLPVLQSVGPERDPGCIQPHSGLWSQRHFVLGVVAIFAYIGIECSFASFCVSYLSDPQIGRLQAAQAGRLLSVFWLVFTVGRFAGSAIQRRVRPQPMLVCYTSTALLLLLCIVSVSGWLAVGAFLLSAWAISIMFPTIFALSIDGLGDLTAKASGILIMALAGAGIIPQIQGFLADHLGLKLSFLLDVICCAYLLFYSMKGYKRVSIT
jgi:FHS family L-fucose permease-like MFS transporter